MNLSQEALKALVLDRTTNGPIKSISEKSIEDYKETSDTQVLYSHIVKWEDNELLYREHLNVIHPCVPTFLDFNTVAFKSTTRANLGELAVGTSITVFGYDVEADGEGKPIQDKVTNKIGDQDVETEVYRLITEDEHGNKLEPKKLMTFRPTFGTDYNKQNFNRLRFEDVLAIIANVGVPRKPNTLTAEQVAAGQKKFDQTDWSLLPSLEPALRKPIINAAGEENQEFIENFINFIPIATNAPSRKAAATADDTTAPVAQVSAGLKKDAFDGPPEATQATETKEPTKGKK